MALLDVLDDTETHEADSFKLERRAVANSATTRRTYSFCDGTTTCETCGNAVATAMAEIVTDGFETQFLQVCNLCEAVLS